MKGDLKTVGLGVAAVLIAGLIFYHMDDIGLISDSRRGFKGIV